MSRYAHPRVLSERLTVELSEDMSMAVARELDRGVIDVEGALRDATRDAAFGLSAGAIVTRLRPRLATLTEPTP